jgi:nuclear RNA export factor
MDPAEGSETQGRGRPEGTGRHSRGRASGRTGYNANISHGSHVTQQAQQAILRGLESQHANILVSRISHGIPEEHEGSGTAQTRDSGAYISLRVRGLKESKAASNQDGGLKDLLNFLERKASGSDTEPRKVRIKKVCLFVTIAGFPEVLCRRLVSTLAPKPARTNSANWSTRSRDLRPKSRLKCLANIK